MKEECNICLIELSDKTIPCCQCKQKFHIKCLKEWYVECLKSQKDVSCPNCRHIHSPKRNRAGSEVECCGNFFTLRRFIEQMNNSSTPDPYGEGSADSRCKEEHIYIIQEIIQERENVSREIFEDNTLNGIIFILSTFICFSFGVIGIISTAAVEMDED